MGNFVNIIKFYFLPKKYSKLIVDSNYLVFVGTLYLVTIYLFCLIEYILGSKLDVSIFGSPSSFLFIKYISLLLKHPIQYFIYAVVIHSILKLLVSNSTRFINTVNLTYISFSTIIFRYVIEALATILKYFINLNNDFKPLTSFALSDLEIVHINNLFISSFLGRIDIFLIWGVICAYNLFSNYLSGTSNYKILLLITFAIVLSNALFISIPLFFLMILN